MHILKPLEILLIEDNEDHAFFIKKSLEKNNFIVTKISDGKTALEYLCNTEQKLDVVLLDYHLPAKDGLEILNELKKIGKDYAVIFLTIDNTVEAAVEALKAGAMEFMPKKGKFYNLLPSVIKRVYSNFKSNEEKGKNEQLLKENQERFKTMANATDEALIILENNRCIEVNAAAEFLFGYNADEFAFKPVVELVEPYYQEILIKYIALDKSESFEIIGKHKNQNIFSAKAGLKNISYKGKAVKILSISNQSTVSKQFDVSQTNENQYKHFVESLDEVVFTFNTLGQITFIASGIVRITGIEAHTYLFKNIDTLVSFNAAEELKNFIAQVIVQTKNTIILPANTNELGDKVIRISVKTIYNNGVLNGFLGLISDVTEQKNEDEIKMRQMLEHKIAEHKHDFLVHFNYEIRNIINGILGMIEFLKKTQVSEKQSPFIYSITSNSKLLLNLFNDVIDLSKLESRKIEIRPRIFNTLKALQDIQRWYQRDNQAKKFQMQIASSVDFPVYIKADRTRLFQVIVNLIGFFTKFSEEGNVDVKVSCFNLSHQNRAIIKAEILCNILTINEENQESLFQVFNKINDSAKLNWELGTLGLLTAKHLVEMMAGRLGLVKVAENVFNIWFTFEAELPSEATLQYFIREIPEIGELEEEIKLNKKILIVEDVLVNQKVIGLMVQSFGCDVMIANNGAEALELFEKNDFDMILMDIQMPVMDGITATAELRKKYINVPPIIAISANAMAGDEEHYLNCGLDDYLAKPITSDALQKKLLKWFNKKYFNK